MAERIDGLKIRKNDGFEGTHKIKRPKAKTKGHAVEVLTELEKFA
jgi:hypothetical protein